MSLKNILLFLISFNVYSYDLTCPDGTKRIGSPPPEGIKVQCIMPHDKIFPGIYHGQSVTWWKQSKKIKSIKKYEDNNLHGESIFFNKFGKKIKTIEYLKGKKNGFLREYDQNEKIISEKYFRNDEELKINNFNNQNVDEPEKKDRKNPYPIENNNDFVLNCTLDFKDITINTYLYISDIKIDGLDIKTITKYFIDNEKNYDDEMELIVTASNQMNLKENKEVKFPIKIKENKKIITYNKNEFKIVAPGVISNLKNLEEQKIKNFKIPRKLEVEKKVIKKTITKQKISIALHSCKQS